MLDLRSFWRWLLAVIAPLPFLALAAGQWLVPVDSAADLPQALAVIAVNPARMQAALWLSLVFAVFAVPAMVAVAWSSRRHAPWLSLVGGVVGIVAFAEAGTRSGSDQLAFAGATHGVAASQVVGISEAVADHPAGQIGMLVFVIGQTIGLLLLGLALVRSRVAPRWMGIVLAISGPAHLAPVGHIGSAIGWLLTAVGCGGACIALLKTPNASFDLPPVDPESDLDGRRTPTPSTGPAETRAS